jgi:Uma2 family endonuclease
MSTITATRAKPAAKPSSAPLAAPEVYRLTVEEYERMADAHILNDDRVELIDGYLVRKMPKQPPHIWTVDAILEELKARLSGW